MNYYVENILLSRKNSQEGLKIHKQNLKFKINHRFKFQVPG